MKIFNNKSDKINIILLQNWLTAKTENDLTKSQIINNNNIVNTNGILSIKRNKCVFVIHAFIYSKTNTKSKTIKIMNTICIYNIIIVYYL